MKSHLFIRSIILIILSFSIHTYSVATGILTDKKVYQCPMKCDGEKIFDKPGRCSVCGMNLMEIKPNKTAEENGSGVKIVGAMMNVMHKGELFGTIELDTITNKSHLYGVAPLEYLKGEILISDGHCFVSKVSSDNSMTVTESYKEKAPFMVYANVENWKVVALPDTVQTIPQLEAYLNQETINAERPFAFKIVGEIDKANIHVVNLPNGVQVHSPADAHQNQKSYKIENQNGELVGFFSTEHAGVFTHHDTYVHIHLITSDKKQMGHVDELSIRKGSAKLYLPIN
jgi:acetolactate decarboxylase